MVHEPGNSEDTDKKPERSGVRRPRGRAELADRLQKSFPNEGSGLARASKSSKVDQAPELVNSDAERRPWTGQRENPGVGLRVRLEPRSYP